MPFFEARPEYMYFVFQSDTLAVFDFLGFARTLILGYGILIQGVQHSFQHQTKGIGRNHET